MELFAGLYAPPRDVSRYEFLQKCSSRSKLLLMQRVTVVGLGIIGSAWAQNLHADKLTVRGWNRSPKDFPFYEPDLVKAVADAEMIIIVVADPPAVENILKIIVPHLKPGQLIAQSSTISAHWTRIFATQVEATGAEFLEAPFTGSKPAAEARKSVFYLGGSDALVEKARSVCLDRFQLSSIKNLGIRKAPIGRIHMYGLAGKRFGMPLSKKVYLIPFGQFPNLSNNFLPNAHLSSRRKRSGEISI